MNKEIRRNLMYGIIGVLILVIVKVLYFFLPEDSTQFVRRSKGIIGYLIVLPVLILTLVYLIKALILSIKR